MSGNRVSQPRLMRASKLREYLDLPARGSLAQIPVHPVRIGTRLRWDVRAVDQWLDQLGGLEASKRPCSDEPTPDELLDRWVNEQAKRFRRP